MKQGLTSQQARIALAKFGLNQLPKKGGVSSINLVIKQVQNPLALLVLGVIVISATIGDLIDAILIALILAYTLSELFRYFKLPRVLGQIMAGVILGIPLFKNALFTFFPSPVKASFEISPPEMTSAIFKPNFFAKA